MAILNIPDEHRRIEDAAAIAGFLAQHGIDYERWTPGTERARRGPAPTRFSPPTPRRSTSSKRAAAT